MCRGCVIPRVKEENEMNLQCPKELFPCPFCGSSRVESMTDLAFPICGVWVNCRTCHVCGPMFKGDDCDAKAEHAWNRRVSHMEWRQKENMHDSESIALFSPTFIKMATGFGEEEVEKFKGESKKHVLRDTDTGGVVVCYQRPNGHILIDEINIPLEHS